MSYDKREALKPGQELNIIDTHSDNSYPIIIEEEIGRGGSCIVYRGKNKNYWIGDVLVPEYSVIVKEFYPSNLKLIFSFVRHWILKIWNLIIGMF